MSRNNQKNSAKKKIEKIKKAILALDLVCDGTIFKRKNTCGTKGCRCKTDPKFLHGPYYEWNRRIAGRLVHRTVSAEQAQNISKGISNHKKIMKLLKKWGNETASMLGVKDYEK